MVPMDKRANQQFDISEHVASKSITVALVGNPNTGKSTLFSRLCGVSARIGNYPGVTVEEKLGRYTDTQGEVVVVDLPGTYSLAARTPDELVSVDVLLGRKREVPPLDAIVVIADATNLERNLYLFTQVRQLGRPTVLVLNVWDRVAAAGWTIDIDGLERRLQVKVVTTCACRNCGIQAVKLAIRQVVDQGATCFQSPLPQVFRDECEKIGRWLADTGQADVQPFLIERLLLDVDGQVLPRICQPKRTDELLGLLHDARNRLASTGNRVPAVETKARYAWIRQQLEGLVQRPNADAKTISDRIDRVLIHRVWGLLIFALVMFLIFQSIYSGATILMDGIESVQGWLASMVAALIPAGPVRSLLTDGVIAGVGSVIVFLPQIMLLFFFIGLLEDCGYMARAAFVMDKLMTRLGLSGKSFLPLMSSYACAIPGIMATRTIENWRDRIVTILIAPLMSCSARLPVYILLITTFVPDTTWLNGWMNLRGLVLMSMHLVGLVVAVAVAWCLKTFFFPSQASPFVMELPSYKWPSPRVVCHRVIERGQAFLWRAGSLIFCTAVLVWAAGYFPGDHTRLHAVTRQIESQTERTTELESAEPLQALLREQRELSGQLIEQSFLGSAGHFIEPAVKPLGWDWKIGIGVLASFPAREVVIATLGTIYSLGGEVSEQDQGLQNALRSAAWPDGKPVYTLPVALSIMVFFALCAQCAATLMVIKRETNSWRWPIVTFVYMTVLAYLGALATFQIGSWILE